MSYPNLANGWTSTLSGAINSSDTTVDVAATAGMPSRPFQAVILAEGANSDEIVTVTNLSSSTITITRATEANAAGSSSASSHASGATISHVLTAAGVRRAVLEPLWWPVTASSYDDEFETTDTSDPMTGWTTLGSPSTLNMNSDAPSMLHIKQAQTNSVALTGVYKAAPSTPFTVTAHLPAYAVRKQYTQSGLILLESGSGKILANQVLYHTGTVKLDCELFTDRTNFSSTPVGVIDPWEWLGGAVRFLRFVVTSSTDIAAYASTDGLIYRLMGSGINPGFTVGYVGLAVNSNNDTHDGDAYFDWIRFS